MKKTIKILITIVLIILIIAIIVKCYKNYNNSSKNRSLINTIKNSYSEYAKVTQNKKIYIKLVDKYQEVGNIYPDTIIPLLKKDVLSKDDIYYQIKGTNYYIDYTNLEKINNNNNNDYLNNYLVTTEIKTNPTRLYQDDNLKIEINKEYTYDVYFNENNKYYIKYLDQIYYVKDSFELIEKDVNNLLTEISVLNFDSNISNLKLEEILSHLKENEYQSISLQDFNYWINGNISLSDKKVLLISDADMSEENKNLFDKYQFQINENSANKFLPGDTKLKVGDSDNYRYDIYNDTTINRIDDILKGIKQETNNKIAVLNYHFFYDGASGENCNEIICLDISNFKKQLEYLKENNYKTLTMKEFNDWMDKKLVIPKKSVLITIDDGAMGTSFINGNKIIPILEEYKMNATLFLITGWWDAANYKSNYLELQSHGDELHHNNYCNGNRCGYKALLLTKEELINDLNTSINKLGTNLAFCYPFYQKNSIVIDALKETGFKLAFSGGNRKTSQKDDKYNIPRYIIYKNTSLNSFIKMLN